MKQITEDYVSFECANLLKEKGFDCSCISYYEHFSSNVTLYSGMVQEWSDSFENHNSREDRFSRPTLQLAMKWLRDDKSIFTESRLCIGDMTDKGLYQFEVFEKTDIDEYTHRGFVYGQSYEEACEAAILYALKNLI